MRFLLDTQVLLWMARDDDVFAPDLRAALADPENELSFSVAGIWEIAIKQGLARADFRWDARAVREVLLSRRFIEMPVTGAHAMAVVQLPRIHKDPFDRILVAQAIVEAVTLVTADSTLAKYPCPVRVV